MDREAGASTLQNWDAVGASTHAFWQEHRVEGATCALVWGRYVYRLCVSITSLTFIAKSGTGETV